MNKKNLSSILGGTDLREPIKVLGKNLYLKLLSVHEALLCENMSRELVEELVNEGSNRKNATPISENACLAYMCLYDRRNNRVFENAFDALNSLTSEELLKISEEYVKVKNKFLNFNNLTKRRIFSLKKN